MKLFLHLWVTKNYKTPIFFNWSPHIRELLVYASIFTYINKVESLLQNLLNNYAENNLYIIDSGIESDHEDLED